jgi:hypothetical protein
MAPLGWRYESGKLIPDESEQELIRIVRGYLELGLSYSDVADKLTEAGFTSRTGPAVFTEVMAKRIATSKLVGE